MITGFVVTALLCARCLAVRSVTHVSNALGVDAVTEDLHDSLAGLHHDGPSEEQLREHVGAFIKDHSEVVFFKSPDHPADEARAALQSAGIKAIYVDVAGLGPGIASMVERMLSPLPKIFINGTDRSAELHEEGAPAEWAAVMAQRDVVYGEFIDELVGQNAVMLFTKSYCPHSRNAKLILLPAARAAHVSYSFLDMDAMEDQVLAKNVQRVLGVRTGASSVPRVFIGGKFVGGEDEVIALRDSGELQPLLEALRKEVDPAEDPEDA